MTALISKKITNKPCALRTGSVFVHNWVVNLLLGNFGIGTCPGESEILTTTPPVLGRHNGCNIVVLYYYYS